MILYCSREKNAYPKYIAYLLYVAVCVGRTYTTSSNSLTLGLIFFFEILYFFLISAEGSSVL